jgi:uncharacterized protein YuzE
MAKVKDILGERPQFYIADFAGTTVDPSKIWSSYDAESDSVVIYLTGRPQLAVSVYADDNLYVMVDPKNREVVGLHIENWERSFIPAHRDIQVVWQQIKRAVLPDQPWDELLRMIAFWTIFALKSENGASKVMQPA